MRHSNTDRTRPAIGDLRGMPAMGVLIVATLGLWPVFDGVRPAADLNAANLDREAVNCRAVSTRALDGLRTTLRSAHSAASADASKNGSTGQYAVAATNSRDLIKRALDRSDRMMADHNASDPRTTTYAEGGTVKEHTRAIIEVLPEAAHWAIVSNIYHNSTDARRAFDLAATALDQGREIFIDASNCYMDGFTP